MEIKCQGCGNAVTDAQAFCPRCGAVIAPEGSLPPRPQQDRSSPDFAATIIGQKFNVPPAPPPKKPAVQPPVARAQPRGDAPPAAPARPAHDHPTAPPPATKNSPALFIVIGFFAVLLVGGLVAFLIYSFLLR